MHREILLLVLGVAVALAGGCSAGKGATNPIFGTVASRLDRAETDYAAGLRAVTFEIYWDRLEPAPGHFDAAQFEQAKRDLAAFREAGMEVVLDLGLQYPPAWAFEVPNSRYVNQYGDAYVDDRPGSNGLNAVFNQQIRDLQAAYVGRVFEELGTEFYAIRLGWCFYGELSYPNPQTADRTNSYWAFDDVAQGRVTGLATTLTPNPVPGWVPGVASQDHTSAHDFLAWYLNALTDYQTWQIATVRRHFDGRLAVLYPSWGVRPGQLEAAIAKDLSGFTSPEQNGEIQRGHDFSRHVASLRDRRVVLHTTWLDASPSFGDDAGDSVTGWSPVHYLANLSQDHKPPLEIWGENTGGGSPQDMQLCVDRLKTFGLTGLFWAFDDQLYELAGGYATIDDYAARIEAVAFR